VQAFDALAKAVDARPSAVESLGDRCRREKWPASVRSCIAKAGAADLAAKCVEPVYGLDKPEPPLAMSEAVKKQVADGGVRALYFGVDGAIKKRVTEYFAGTEVPLAVHDRLAEVELVTTYRIAKDEVVVLVRQTNEGERSYSIELDKKKMTRFDKEVSAVVTKLMRETRRFYVTTGHGEMGGDRKTTSLDKRLAELHFEKVGLDRVNLTDGMPDNAVIVAILGPEHEFSKDEQETLGRYLDRGGALLVAFDPKGIKTLGALDARLGVKLAPGHLADDKSFLPQRGAVSDHAIIVTNKFSAHASTTALSRASNQGLVLLDASALDAVPTTAKKTTVIRTAESTFLDRDGDFTFDDGKEKRQSYDVAVAVEDKFRALVLGDVDLFADAAVQSGAGRMNVIMIGGPLFIDAVRWLAGEEVFAGEIVADEPPEKPDPNAAVLDEIRALP